MRHICGRIIGATWGNWEAVTSLENSVNTRIAPWTKLLSSDNRACMRIPNKSGHVSGQSQCAIAEIAYAWSGKERKYFLSKHKIRHTVTFVMMGLIKEKEKRVSSFLSERILVGYSLHIWDWCSLVLRVCCVFLLNMISLIHGWWGSETWLVKCTVRSNKKSWWNTYKIGVFLLCKILSFHCHCPKSPCPCITYCTDLRNNWLLIWWKNIWIIV
jgi:hypothetical protein